MGGFLFGLFFWLFIPYVIFKSVYRPRPKTDGGLVTFRPSHEYGYIVGDNLWSYAAYGNYNGLDISLPLEMPHIYLDSLKAGGRRVSAVFDAKQRIVLEGDFNHYFNVFVPRGYEVIALSILTPDVMETLQRYASHYDVEIYGAHLRIICDRKVLKSSQRQAEMMEVAGKVVKEIEDRELSWTENNNLAAIDQDLLIYRSKGLRLFGRYVTWTWFWLSMFWFMTLSGFIGSAVLLIYQKQYVMGTLLLAGTTAVFGRMVYDTASSHAGDGFWSRRG